MKTKSLLLSLLMFASTVNMLAAFPTNPLSGGGSGTQNDPYKIATAGDLIAVRDAVNAAAGAVGVATAYYELSNDIDMSANEWLSPIGTSANRFKGNFNGKLFKITGLYLGSAGTPNATAPVLGLFGNIESATIANLEVTVQFYYSKSLNGGGVYTFGGLVSTIEAGTNVIDNCKVSGAISATRAGTANTNPLRVGGLVGLVNANTTTVKISNSSTDVQLTAINTVTTTTNGGAYCGGVIGEAITGSVLDVVNCYALGSIIARSDLFHAYAGGIIGTRQGAAGSVKIYNCYAANTIDAYGYISTYIGGIIGNCSNLATLEIRNCIALNPHIYAYNTNTTTPTAPFINRIVSSINASNNLKLSDNYALDVMDAKGWQSWNGTSGTSANPTITSSATGVHGATLDASDPAGQTKTKLNAYVTANSPYGGTGLRSWTDGTTYPKFLAVLTNSGNTLSSMGISATDFANIDLTVNSGEMLINQSVTLKSVVVSAGAKLTIGEGNTLMSNRGIVLQSNTNGTATLVDSYNAPNTINGTVQQYLGSARNWYVTPPISGATVPSGQTYYKYDETGSNTGYTGSATAFWVAQPQTTALTAGIGYITQPGSSTTLNFTGVLKSGTVTVALTRTGTGSVAGFNLVANPYPSYMNWQLVDTTTAKVMSTIWYRTKTSLDAYTFDTYNGGLQVATTNGAIKVTNLIPPMQAFWVRVKSGQTSGTLTFTNSMRAHVDDGLNKFKARAISETKLLRLRVSNGVNSDESLICFNANAQNTFDNFDSQKRFNNSNTTPEIYTLIGAEKLVINGLNDSNPVSNIALGFIAGEKNDYTITATELSNFAAGTQIILKDNLLNVETNITDGTAYPFSSEALSSDTRFTVILKTIGTVNGFESNKAFNNSIVVYQNASSLITVNCPNDLIGKARVNVFNALGQKLESQTLTNTNLVVKNKYVAGTYIVSVTTEDKVAIKKIVLN